MSQYKAWIDGQIHAVESSLTSSVQQLEYIYEKPLKGTSVLVFGSGFGGSSVALALKGAKIYGVDIAQNSIKIAQKRAIEHNLAEDIAFICLEDTTNLHFPDSYFDIVTCDAVLEHIVGDRTCYLKEMWRVLKKKGILYISNTPNILYPYDSHVTNLFLLPWMSAKTAKKYALLRKKCLPSDNLELMGRRGMTFWSIMRALKKENYMLISTSRQCNLITYMLERKRINTKKKKILFPLLFVLNYVIALPLNIPVSALLPDLTFIALQKN
ncbi:MAG: hypothetical protein A2Y62_16525 [Candidatus Fischerbacteria bacterium RBG_13_37_8]|uniref:Methyltransferase type 11 domain-containing protein n=1 Tax=Candidatus Fischerbacteria bacterium RBG_13_37_8 TaxID=1817863 RepID=A0A1F5VNQ3_9BACT|nr:MAG: hypothetical protein A2Y62_16525 [Candidatus Fischerbacteria bacterium RBG_13_37_8]